MKINQIIYVIKKIAEKIIPFLTVGLILYWYDWKLLVILILLNAMKKLAVKKKNENNYFNRF